jgi:D-methionine transport system permease protein
MINGSWEIIVRGLGETIYMVILTTIFTLIFGTILGVILVVTEKGNILEAPKLNKILGIIINVTRSFPTLILIVILLPLSRLIIGTTLGTNAAIVPLVIGSSPFFGRVVESSLKEVERGKTEAAIAMGTHPIHIITKVLIPEALPSLVRGITLNVIAIIGSTAIAGAIGAGGLGSIAIRYGYQRFQTNILVITAILLIVLVQGIQLIGDLMAKRINKKRFKFD